MAALVLALTLPACSTEPGGAGDAATLRRLLAEDRRAHLELDAALLASHVADTLLSIDDGRVSRPARSDVEASFRRYFKDARYHEWADVHEPIVRVARGGGMAWVVRTVRVDREQPGVGGKLERSRFTCAWTATYERSAESWLMTTVASTFLPEPTSAERILAAAARRWGDPDRLAALSTLRAAARARGPEGEFGVTVCSGRDGRASIRFSSGFSAGIDAKDTWMLESPEAAPQDLGRELETFLRGHEVHMNLAAPETRYGKLHYAGKTTFAGQPALRLAGSDALGAAAEFFYAQQDSAPLGFRVADHLRGGEPPAVEVGDWDEAGPLRLFRRAVFRQGAEEFAYRYEEIEIDPAGADSLFRASR